MIGSTLVIYATETAACLKLALCVAGKTKDVHLEGFAFFKDASPTAAVMCTLHYQATNDTLSLCGKRKFVLHIRSYTH
jgi:hypothetical protein